MVTAVTSASFGSSPPTNLPSSDEIIVSSFAIASLSTALNRTFLAAGASPSSRVYPQSPPMKPISLKPDSSSVSAMSVTMVPNPAAFATPAISSAVNFPPFAYHASNVASPLRFARIPSDPPVHSPVSTPPGVPRIAGVVPAGNASRNHAGLSLESMRNVSNSIPDSRIIKPRRRQYGQNGITGPSALSPSSSSAPPYDARELKTAFCGTPGFGGPGGAGCRPYRRPST